MFYTKIRHLSSNMEDLEPICETEQTSFCVELLKRLNMQRGIDYLCDVTLVAKEGKEFKAHRNVLSAASPFFAKLLQSEMKEKEEGVIRFEEISESILGDVLEFIYIGSVKITEGNAKDLIIAADYLLLLCLKTKSGRFLKKLMTRSNCISTLHFAEKYRCEELVDSSTKFIHDNFASVAESDEFLNLEVEEVENCISSEKICVAVEEDVFRIIQKWIEHNKSERKDKFEQLFRHVRLVSVSRDYLLVDVVTNDLVTEHPSCLRQVLDAIKLVSSASEDTLMQSPGRRLETHAIVARGGKYTYCYLPERDTWKRLADGLSDPHGNHEMQMIKFRDQLYTFPGNNKAERYDPAFNSWATLDLSPPSSYQTNSLVVVRGQIYAICEFNRRTNTSTIKRYDVELHVWQTILSFQERYYRNGSCVVSSGDCLYVLGGSYRANAARFNTMENKWEEIASMKRARSYAFGVASRGKIFIVGGGQALCEVYNACTNEWQSIGSLNTRHAGG